jgi:hypothetical protein
LAKTVAHSASGVRNRNLERRAKKWKRVFRKNAAYSKNATYSSESRCCADSDELQKHLVRRIGKNKAAAKAVDEFVPAGALPAQALSLPR